LERLKPKACDSVVVISLFVGREVVTTQPDLIQIIFLVKLITIVGNAGK